MSMTPDHFKKVGLGITASPSPFLTPRPERRRPEPRANDWNFNRLDKDKEVNVQVLLRCRPFSEEEQKSNVPRAISCNEQKREVTVSQNVGSKQVDKVFTFDKVFGPKAQQRSIYDQAISPIVNEVLEGFNCTVFAYGQTGTGKTYTMEGGMRNKGGELPVEAGVIPRAVRQIFDTLDAQNADYSMRVTFLELYNEEITDLLASEDHPRGIEDRQKKPITLMEDGRGCVNVRGLEEETVYSANEIYSLLERGAAKRRTADTLLNKRSSRSHSVFSITILVKEAAVGSEDVVKCGKLNLVDLAGSENISRSGARESRAREAGEINKSLLTLGRVINALVEHSIHIPYRDSKLTRLLRDSLGGKTKTCIIATISPSPHCLDETLSTLDYAHRAKNIKNKPEANQKLSKVALLKELYMEIERMKQDVRAAREKNGVYIPHERYAQDEAEKKAMKEKNEQLQIDLDVSEKQVEKYRELYLAEQEVKLDLESELKNCKMNLEKSTKALLDLQEKHKLAISTLEEKEFLIKKMLHSENSLIECSKGLRMDLQSAAEDISSLFKKIDQKNRVESENQDVVSTFRSRLHQNLEDLHKVVVDSISQQEQQLRCMEEHVSSFLVSKHDTTQVLESKLNKLMGSYSSGMKTLKDLAYMLQTNTSSDLEHLKSTISAKAVDVDNFLGTAVSEAKEIIDDIQRTLHEQKFLLSLSAKQQQEGLHRTLVSANAISKATIGFFSDLQNHASKVHRNIEESEIHLINKLAKFEETFKEEAAKEEKLALEKIAGILETLTSKKEAMVSEISRNIQQSGKEESKRMHQELSYIQQVSSDAKEELHKYMEKVEASFLEDTFAAAEAGTTMESCLQDCSTTVELSKTKWENTYACISNQNKTSDAEIEAAVKQNICANVALLEQFKSASDSIEGELDVQVTGMSGYIKESFALDQASKKEMDTMLNLCLGRLKPLRENHDKSLSSIRGEADKSLGKDYQMDSSEMPKQRVIQIPTVASLEEMRTARAALKEDQTGADCNRENGVKWENHVESKQLSMARVSPNRMPFGAVN